MRLLDDAGRNLHALLTRLTLREDVAEDLMQELFLKLMRSRGFSTARNPAAYAYHVAMNLAFDWRRQKRRTRETREWTDNGLVEHNPALARLIRDEQLQQVLDAIHRLPRTCREAFVLRHLQEQPYEHVAQQLNRSPHQARALCHKALRKLQASLNHEPHKRKETSRDLS